MAEQLDLYHELNTKHPDYLQWSDEWDLYRDILGDVDVEKEKYLPRGRQENQTLYDFRVKLSQFIPESVLAVTKVVASLYSDKPKRDIQNPQLESFLENVDLEGSSFNSFMEQVAFQLLGYGTVRLLINIKSPEVEEGKELTRADEIEQAAQPFLVLYSPMSVIDWDTDEYGHLRMARIKEQRIVHLDKGHGRLTKFIQYDEEKVRTFEFIESREDIELVNISEQEHGLGMVPMVIGYYRKVKPMIGSSYIRYSSRADVRKFQAESDLAYDTYIHAHPTLKAKVKGELSQVGVGTNTFLKLDPDANEDVSYVEPPRSSFDILKFVIQESRESIFRQAGVDPLGIFQSGTSIYQSSGIARAWSFTHSEARILSGLASTMEGIERRVFDLVLRFLDDVQVNPTDKLFDGDVIYPQEFDLASTAELMAETANIAQIINSDTLLKSLHKRIAASKVGDTTSETLKMIMQEIDEGEILNKPQTPSEIKEEQEAMRMPPPSEEATNEKAEKKSDTKKETPGTKKKANSKSKVKKPKGKKGKA